MLWLRRGTGQNVLFPLVEGSYKLPWNQPQRQVFPALRCGRIGWTISFPNGADANCNSQLCVTSGDGLSGQQLMEAALEVQILWIPCMSYIPITQSQDGLWAPKRNKGQKFPCERLMDPSLLQKDLSYKHLCWPLRWEKKKKRNPGLSNFVSLLFWLLQTGLMRTHRGGIQWVWVHCRRKMCHTQTSISNWHLFCCSEWWHTKIKTFPFSSSKDSHQKICFSLSDLLIQAVVQPPVRPDSFWRGSLLLNMYTFNWLV